MKASKVAGLYMQSISDMIAYSQALSIPPTLSLLTAAPSSALVTSVVTVRVIVHTHGLFGLRHPRCMLHWQGPGYKVDGAAGTAAPPVAASY